MRVYLDTCILVYRTEGNPSFQAAAYAALRTLGAADVGAISDLVRMECLVKPLRLGDLALRAAYETQFAGLELLPMLPAIFDLGAELRASGGLRTPDALHAACAIHHGCDELWTNDDRLAALGGRIRTRVVR